MATVDREIYKTDSRVSLARFPVLIAGAVSIALFVGWLLYVFHLFSIYFVIIVPAAAGFLAGFLLRGLIGWSKCRNIAFATFLGLVVGAVTFLSGYHFSMVHQFGPVGPLLIHRIDLLPDYIQFRLQNDVVGDANANPAKPPAKPNSIENTLLFAWEFLTCMIIGAVFARLRAMRAFSPDSDRWMNRESISFGQGAGPMLAEALDHDALEKALPHAPRAREFQKDTHLILEYSSDGSPFDEPVYLTIAEFGPFKLRSMGTNRYYLLRQVELTTKETLQLAPLYPKLSQLLVKHHEELQFAELQSPLESHVPSNTTDVATIEPVEEEYRNQIRTKHYAIMVNLIDLSPLVVMFVGIGLAVLGGWLIPQGKWIVAAIPLLGIGIVVGFWGLYVAGFQPNTMASKWIKRNLVRAVSERPKVWVDLEAEDLTYVSLIPREHFSKIMLTLATDHMLLHLDEANRVLVMEGDSNRYRIPVGAISICEPEVFYMSIDAQKNVPIWTIRLVVRVPEGSRELLLAMSPVKIEWRAARKRELRVKDWCERIFGVHDNLLG